MNTEKLLEWQEAKKQLDHFKKLEVKMRKEILEELFPSAGEGTLNTSIGNIIVKGGFKYNASLDRDALQIADLTDEEAECINWAPSLSKTKYSELEPSQRKSLDGCLTFKPALPTLTIKIEEDL